MCHKILLVGLVLFTLLLGLVCSTTKANKGSVKACHDKWRLSKCIKKERRGRCAWRKTAKNCQKTCGFCTDICKPYGGCGISPKSSRIIGGDEASPNSIPWQVGLLFAYKNYANVGCGGTLLTDKHVLSAAHCMCNDRLCSSLIDASDIRVVVGEHDQSDSFDGIRHEVRSYTNHPQYDPLPDDNDFSILHLTSPVELGDVAVPACLPDLRFSDDKLVGKHLTVSGWGRTVYPDFDYPDLLQTVDVPVISQDDCRKAYGETRITDSMICAGNTTGGMDACHRDSGGPLTYEENGKSYLIGVVSWGRGCALAEYPGVYARVTMALDWIQKELGSSC